jgi:hypothetical protein
VWDKWEIVIRYVHHLKWFHRSKRFRDWSSKIVVVKYPDNDRETSQMIWMNRRKLASANEYIAYTCTRFILALKRLVFIGPVNWFSLKWLFFGWMDKMIWKLAHLSSAYSYLFYSRAGYNIWVLTNGLPWQVYPTPGLSLLKLGFVLTVDCPTNLTKRDLWESQVRGVCCQWIYLSLGLCMRAIC